MYSMMCSGCHSGRAAAFSAQRPTVAQNSEYVSTESILSWDGKYEVWELKPWGSQKWLFCSVVQKL